MTIDKFSIIAVEMINPSSPVGHYATVLAILFIGVCFFILNHARPLPLSMEPRPVLKVFISIAIFTIGSASGYVWYTHDKQVNTEAYTSHITCRYTLNSDTETIQYVTLIERVERAKCSKVGKEVIRITTPTSIKYYQDFEIPN